MNQEGQEPSQIKDESKMMMSRLKSKKKTGSKLSMYETNMENFMANQQYALEKVNPKGLVADAVYFSFTGVIESAQLFLSENEDLQVNYQIILGDEWHNQAYQLNNINGTSTFCEAKDGKISFSLSFDCLLSCVYIQSWPQLIMTIKGFSNQGQIITKGYAQIHLPIQSGLHAKQAYIYSIHRQESFYQRWFRFLAPNPLTLEQKQFQRIIAKGQGREVQKIRSIGKIKIRTEVLKRNYGKFGYK